MVDADKKRLLDAALVEYNRDPEARKALARVIEAAARESL